MTPVTPKVFAHRGASAHAPENTIKAFQLALDQDADGIELDVTLSKDGEIVVIHDDNVDRTTNGSGTVTKMSLAELQVLDAGGGEHIPTLNEVFDLFGGKFLINIELKNIRLFSHELSNNVATLIKSYGLMDAVIISSFNPFYLQYFHQQCPEVIIGLLTLPKMAQQWFWKFFRYDALHPYYKDVNQALVERMHNQNRSINTWTVDDPAELLQLAKLNVDSIITNDPLRTRQVLESSA
jgi:glycerophosphoryl diester phosphodiesterase